MTGEQVRILRKKLGMTQQEFADRIGIKRNTIANYEVGRNDPVDSVSALICREFNVRREWLETGEGDMFAQPDEFSLDDFLREHGADALEVELMKAYFELDPDMRHRIVEQFKENLKREQQQNRVADAEEEYIKSNSRNARNADSTASNTTEGVG